MKLGAQLYTLRNFIQNEKDVDTSFGKVAEMGYKTVQVSAIGPIKPEIVREKAEKHGLEIVLTHIPADRILYDTENVIKDHDILGCKYIGLGAMPEKYRDPQWIHQFHADFIEPAKKIADAGKLFMYHNHNFEFGKINGKRILDIICEDFKPNEMGITLDTYWVQAGGADIMDVIDQLHDRIPCVHYKDMAVDGWTPIMAPCMEGNINFAKITDKLLEYGQTEHVLVEQDTCLESPFVCLKKSYDNLMSLGKFEE